MEIPAFDFDDLPGADMGMAPSEVPVLTEVVPEPQAAAEDEIARALAEAEVRAEMEAAHELQEFAQAQGATFADFAKTHPPDKPLADLQVQDDSAAVQALVDATEALIAAELAAAEQAEAMADAAADVPHQARAVQETQSVVEASETTAPGGAIDLAADSFALDFAIDFPDEGNGTGFDLTQVQSDEEGERLAASLAKADIAPTAPVVAPAAPMVEVAAPAIMPAATPSGAVALEETGALADVVAVKVPARLLEYDRGRHIALPVHVTIEVMETPEIVKVPGSARYALGMVRWQGRFVALMDLRALLLGQKAADAYDFPYALALAYQSAPKMPVQHAMLGACSLPETVQVGDAMACDLPMDCALWRKLALSCFLHQGEPVPIIDTGRLFGVYWG